MKAIYFLTGLVAVGLLAGCGRQAAPSKTEKFFVDWLKAHGETNVLVDRNGVGIAGNSTRLKASKYDVKKHQDAQYVVETEFKIRIPGGGEIIEYLAGLGDTEDKATDDSLVNFTLTTFHVIYKCYVNTNDPHQELKPMVINGAKRELAMGDIYVRGTEGSDKMDLGDLRQQIEGVVTRLPLTKQPHWIKVVYSQNKGKPQTVAVSLDNFDDAGLTSAMKALKWPKSENFYMLKEFIVVK